MKNTLTKLFVLILAAAMLSSLCLTAGAAEVDKSVIGMAIEDIRNGGMPDYAMESAKNTSSGSAAGVFALELKNGKTTGYFSAFLVQQGGEVYLVCAPGIADLLKQYDLTLKSSGSGGFSAKASVVGSDENVVYLKASGLENFSPLSIASQFRETGVLVVESIENDGSVSGLMTARLDFDDMDIYEMNGSDELALFDVGSKPLDIILGAPVVTEDTAEVMAIGCVGQHPGDGNTYPLYFTILAAELDDDYALDFGSNGGGKTEPEDRDEDRDEKRDEDREDDRDKDRDDDRKNRDEEEDEKEFEVKPLWVILLALAAVAVFLKIRSRNQGNGSDGPVLKLEPDPDDPAVEDIAPRAFRWEVKGLTGCFTGKSFPLDGMIRFGRNDQCKVRFPEGTPGISSNHCEISLQGGSVLLTDLGSSYGTFAGGGKLVPNVPHSLIGGETFTLAEGESFRVEKVAIAEAPRGITVRDLQGRVFHTDSDRMTFGRGQDNKVVLSDQKSVSTSHCVLFREGGKLHLKDAGSTNGTFFNEENRLQPNTPYRIRKGMAFYLVNRENTFVVLED